jgi:hypothetical protein
MDVVWVTTGARNFILFEVYYNMFAALAPCVPRSWQQLQPRLGACVRATQDHSVFGNVPKRIKSRVDILEAARVALRNET